MGTLIDTFGTIFVIFAVTLNLILGWLVYYKDRTSATNNLFATLSALLSIWLLVIVTSTELTSSAFAVTFWPKLSLFWAAPMTLTFFLFAHTFPATKLRLNQQQLFSLIGVTAGVMIYTALSPSFDYLIENGNFITVAKPHIIPFAMLSTFFSAGAVYQLFRKIQSAKGVTRKQLQYIITGLMLMTGLMTFSILIPVVFYENNSFVRLAPLYVLIFLSMTAYTIVKHKLFDIKIFATQAFVVILSVFFLARIFIAREFTQFAIELSFFLATIFFGYLLIQSVAREVKQRDQLKKLNDTLQTKNAQLEELLKMKTEFVGIVSHQLRTPLTVLRGLLDMQLSGDFKDLSKKRVRELQENMLASSVRLIQLVNDLMESTKMEGGIRLHLQPVNIDELLERIVHEMRGTYKERGLYLKLDLQKSLPQIIGDSEYLHEAFSNLVDNAEKYTKKGGTTIQAVTDDDEVVITISDTGIGLTEDDKKRLFQKFSRGVRSQDLHTEGTGLGLYIVKRIIDAHNGNIHFESEGENKGTQFIVHLPTEPE